MVISFSSWCVLEESAGDVRIGVLGHPTRDVARWEGSAVGAGRRRGLPGVLLRSTSAPAVTELTGRSANTDASGPSVPPVSHAGVPGLTVVTAMEPPRVLPETAAPKR
jgi:hypothetical protein